jgi:hypothetical protein
VIFTPLAADHHYVLLSIPLLIVVSSRLATPSHIGQLIAILVIAYLVNGWWPTGQGDAHSVFPQLLSSLRLFGAIGLWFMLVSLDLSGNNSDLRSQQPITT